MHYGKLFKKTIKHNDKKNKAAAQRARKSLGDIKKLVTDYRKASVE